MRGGEDGSGGPVAIWIGDGIGADAGRIGEAASDGCLSLITEFRDGSRGRGTIAIVEAEIIECVDVKVLAHGRIEGGRGANLVQDGNISAPGVGEPGR